MPPIGSAVDISCGFFRTFFGRDEPQPVLPGGAELFRWLHCLSASRVQRRWCSMRGGRTMSAVLFFERRRGDLVGFQSDGTLLGEMLAGY